MVIKIKTILALSVVLALASCNQNSTEENVNEVSSNETQIEVEDKKDDLSKGFQLLESGCFSCHSPNPNSETKIAPSLVDIKSNYLHEGMSKEEFSNSFVEFAIDPNEEKVKIVGAVEQFGLMPKFNFSKEQLSEMASYIYHTELEAPGWFEKYFEEEKQKYKVRLEDLPYVEQGQSLAMMTKSVLGKNLKKAIKSKGAEFAVQFCNEKAYPLVDSMSVVLNSKIKRVSDKPRNPLNVANESELSYIEKVKQLLLSGEEIKPQVQEIDGKMIGYYPIVTNKMCMQCHGEPDVQILPTTLEKLNLLYPEDLATGYLENQLRGIWVVEMNKK